MTVALVTKVNRFDFEDDKGKQITGAKLHYLPVNFANPQTNSSGEETISISLPYDEFSVFHGNVPCIADLDIGFTQSGTKTRLRYNSGKIRQKLDFSKLPGANG